MRMYGEINRFPTCALAYAGHFWLKLESHKEILADDKETIVATRIITTGEEIQCYYDASDNKKST